MNKDSKIFVAGASGMVGSSIIRKLISLGYNNILGSYNTRWPRIDVVGVRDDTASADNITKGLELRQLNMIVQKDIDHFFKEEKPEYVFLAAARVGGIFANNTYPGQFIRDNLAIQCNVIHAAYQHGVDRLLFLGSSCIYPKHAPQPMKEEHLLSGLLEPTNEPYAIAKISGIKMCEAYNRQYGTSFMAVMPTNLYGPNDNFDLENSHVLPALLRRFHEAKITGKKEVIIWGTGTAKREFLHVDDMADASVFIMEIGKKEADEYFLNYPTPCFINIGSGRDCTIEELSRVIKKIVGFKGDLVFDSSKPDGTLRKLLDVSGMQKLGWEPKISLRAGIKQTYDWYLNNHLNL